MTLKIILTFLFCANLYSTDLANWVFIEGRNKTLSKEVKNILSVFTDKIKNGNIYDYAVTHLYTDTLYRAAEKSFYQTLLIEANRWNQSINIPSIRNNDTGEVIVFEKINTRRRLPDNPLISLKLWKIKYQTNVCITNYFLIESINNTKDKPQPNIFLIIPKLHNDMDPLYLDKYGINIRSDSYPITLQYCCDVITTLNDFANNLSTDDSEPSKLLDPAFIAEFCAARETELLH